MYRILVLTSTFPRWKSDAEPRFVLDLCRRLAEVAHVCVIAPHAPGAAFVENIDGVEVRRFRYFVTRWQALTFRGGIAARIAEKPWRVFQLPFLFVALGYASLRTIREWRPDVIHAHWIIPQGLVASIVSGNRTPVVCTSHGGDLFSLRALPFRLLKTWTLRRCALVTVVSDGMVDAVKQLAPDTPVSVIPMGVEVAATFTPPERPGERRTNEIVFVGRLVPGKGVDVLIRAVESLRCAQLDVWLTIVGDGPLREKLMRQTVAARIEDRVHFRGSRPHTDLPDIYREATVAVFPFVEQQGFGLVVIEAMACGCPVIASDLPAMRQSIVPGVTGTLTPPGEPDALAHAIRDCLSGSQSRTMATAALAYVRRTHDWPRVSRQYLKAMKTTILDERQTLGP